MNSLKQKNSLILSNEEKNIIDKLLYVPYNHNNLCFERNYFNYEQNT